MRGRSLRRAALMIGGALIFVQALATALDARSRRPVDPTFAAEIQQAQYYNSSRYAALGARKAD